VVNQAKEEAIVALWGEVPGRCGLWMERCVDENGVSGLHGFWETGNALVEGGNVMHPWGNPCCSLDLDVEDIVSRLGGGARHE